MVDPGISEPGGPGPRVVHVEFLRSWDCFDAPSQIPYVFVVRVENKIHNCTHCMLTTVEIYACYGFNSRTKFTKTNQKHFQTLGGVPTVRRSWIRLWDHCFN